MIDFLSIMALPFLACLILVGIHTYLGLHVLERKVIFVDLALAQIAALGGIIGILLGIHFEDPQSYWFSLGATLIGACIFSLTRSREEKIPQEAIIGIVYVVAAALAILILSKSASGDEHIREMLVGNILLVDSGEILKIFLLYSLVGIFHWIYREKFLLISMHPEEAYRQDLKVKLWDLAFYATFGVVVTSSVHIAGVLLVFSFLIIPAASAFLLASRFRYRLLLGWCLGTAMSVAGLSLSYILDLPTGATVICSLALALIVVFLLKSK